MRGLKPQIKSDIDALDEAPPPDWLSPDAKAEWRQIVPLLLKRRILTDADLGSVANYCIAMGQVREMQRKIDRLGHVLEIYEIDKDGNSRVVRISKNPAVSIQSDAMTRARLLAAELGCTPVSRSRASVEDNEGQDDFLDGLGLI